MRAGKLVKTVIEGKWTSFMALSLAVEAMARSSPEGWNLRCSMPVVRLRRTLSGLGLAAPVARAARLYRLTTPLLLPAARYCGLRATEVPARQPSSTNLYEQEKVRRSHWYTCTNTVIIANK